MSAIFSADIMPGKKAVDAITFLDSDLEDNGITNIEDVEVSFNIFNTDSWDTVVDTDVVTISF